MKILFSYYGAKNQHADKYGPPRRDVVCEPFAGSAGYSVFWNCPRVRLYDLDENICAIWDWIINCSEGDIDRMKEPGSNADYMDMPDGLRQMFLWSITFAKTCVPNHLPPKYMDWLNGKKVHPAYLLRYERWMDGRVRERMREFKRIAVDWKIEQASYESVPEELMETAHFHVDPPYMKKGKSYIHSDIDYAHLGEWCRQLRCADVCEGEDADWLPFEELYTMRSNSRSKDGEYRRVPEMIWSPDHDHSGGQKDMFA